MCYCENLLQDEAADNPLQFCLSNGGDGFACGNTVGSQRSAVSNFRVGHFLFNIHE